ncbi:hypothetical protein ACJMK2_031429 [Sinanodonta woodiana]|uniref:Sister chromatid cohesion protein PDS5 homolog A n=1 Tax=Sinanodonta woodiana TaxID=1069815 RepID=A0ABD3WZA9_SINWO
MSIIPRGSTKPVKILYPSGCKEVTEDLGKDELVRRLKLIARAFQDMGQDENEPYAGLALHLATDFFLDHANKDVRLLVACCIADIFRVFAPDAPYRDASHLKEIFMFLIKQLRGLEDPNSPTFKRYFYLLENLAWVKSFNICIELDDSQEIFCSLFQLMFSIVNEKHSSKVKNFMMDMMTPLIAEADIVSQELLDIILINIVEPHKTQNRHAYQIARDLLVRTSNNIEPYIQAFFNNALMLGKTSESELSEHLYDLIYELNGICPSVLLAVLPQLEFKLKSNEEAERKAVTRVLAKMFSDPGSNLAGQNKQLWFCFLGRFNDISITVRTICVQSAQNFLMHHPDLQKDIIEQLKSRQHDPEETVRMEVVNTLLNVARRDFNNMSEELIEFIKERTRDKKYKIRREALLGLGQIYKSVMGQEDVQQRLVEKIHWFKDKVFHAYYQNSAEDRLLVERIFNMFLVPYTLPTLERMKRLFLLYATLDEHAVKAFTEMLKNRNLVRMLVRQLLEALDLSINNPSAQIFFHPKLAAIARTLPDPQKSLDQMKRLHHLLRDDKKLQSFFKMLVSPDCTCKKAQDIVKEVLKKLGGNNASPQNPLYNTVKYLLERIASVMIDTAAIDLLVKHVDETVRSLGSLTEGIDNAGEKGVKLLLALSTVFPNSFKSEETFEILLTFLKDDEEVVVDTALQIFTTTGQNLHAAHPNIYSSLLPVLQSLAKIGTPKQSKHAIRCINAVAQNKEAILSHVFEHVKNHINPDSANYITSIVALGHIAQLCPEQFLSEIKTIVSKIIVKDLLMQDRTSGAPSTDSWCPDHQVSEETQAKIQAMKMLVRWLLGLKSNVNNSGISTLRLLYTVIIHEGDLMEKGKINKPELARLRLQAGCCMLKLAEELVFADLISREQFQALALLINDGCYHVRLKFALKLHKGLMCMKLPLDFMAIFALAASDPMRERRNQIKQFLQQNINKRREYLKQNPSIGNKIFLYLPDYVMPYTIHLLAHDPDLKTYDHVEALGNIKDCLWFMMEPLVSRSEDYNYQFFRRLIENIKQAKDAQGPDDEDMNKKLYAVCDVALGLLQANITNVVLKESNLDPILPMRLFTQPDKSSFNTQSYLPKEFNFDNKRKGVYVFTEPHHRGGTVKQTSLQEIIVESPGPVVNPNPTCPREQRIKTTRKLKIAEKEKDLSDSSRDAEFLLTPEKENENEENTLKELEPSLASCHAKTDDRKEGIVPKKARRLKKGDETKASKTRQTTLDEFSVSSQDNTAQETLSDSQDITGMELSEKTTDSQDTTSSNFKQTRRKTVRQKSSDSNNSKVKVIQQMSLPSIKGNKETQQKEKAKGKTKDNVKPKSTSRKRSKSSTDSSGTDSGSKKRKISDSEEVTSSKKSKGPLVEKDSVPMNLESGLSSSSSAETLPPSPSKSRSRTPSSSQSSSGSFKSPTSPPPTAKGLSRKRAASQDKIVAEKGRITRGVLKDSSPSPSKSSHSEVPSPVSKTVKRKAATPVLNKPVEKVTLKITNVRRARSMINGTSDGEDSIETEPSKSPSRAAALAEAIQKVGLEKEEVRGKRKTKAKKK